jgi:hypothetical protein
LSWNYRIIREDRPDKEEYFAIHEVYYDEKNNVYAWTKDPIDICVDTEKEIIETLEDMLKDAKKYPVLKMSELEKIENEGQNNI